MRYKIFYLFIGIIWLNLAFTCKHKTLETNLSSKDLFELLSKKPKGINFYKLPNSNDFEHIPQDTSNPLSAIRIALGQSLFFDPALSFDPKCKEAARTFSCGTCHFSDVGFQAGIKQSIAGGGRGHGWQRTKHPLCDSINLDIQMLRTPSIVNCAYQEVQLWSGKLGCCGPNFGTDSIWPKGSFVELNRLGMKGVETQARVALEAHGIRMNPKLILETKYGMMFDSAFKGVDPRLIYRRFSMAKAIAAYERTVLTNKAPFQQWLHGDTTAMSNNQIKGAYLFFGKAACDQCHTGPALNSMQFCALGVNDMTGSDIIQKQDPPEDVKLGRAGFTHREEDKFKFKVPQLYNLKNLKYLGHGGGFRTIEEIVNYKNRAIKENPNVDQKYIDSSFKPLELSTSEVKSICDFIENGLFDPDLKRYEPHEVASGFCFPNADQLSKCQLHCVICQ